MNLQAVPVGDSKVRQRLYESGRWTHGIIPFGNGRQVLHCMSIYGFAGAVGSSAIAEKKRNLSYRCCLKYSRTTIWQTHIEQWYGESDTPQPQPTVTPAAPATESQPIIKRGHVLKLIPSGGILYCRCGRSTKLVKHQRLKILNKVCTFPDLPPEEWLSAPGFRNVHSLAAAEKELNDKHNKGNHQLVWNRMVGKDKSKSNFRKLWCLHATKNGHGTLDSITPSTPCANQLHHHLSRPFGLLYSPILVQNPLVFLMMPRHLHALHHVVEYVAKNH
jgi:hypothetical protein